MGLERVCIVGAGAIGSLLAAHLARVADAWVLTRREGHARAIEANGLRVSGKAEFVSRPRATADPATLPDAGLVFVATKSTQLEEAAASIAGRLPGATVATVQNGLGAEEIVRRHGDWPLISGTTLMGGTRHHDTHVEYELDAPTWLGSYAGTATPFELVEKACALIVRSGLKAEGFRDLRPAQWAKLIFNAAVGGVSALTGLPHARTFADEREASDLGHLVHELIEEGKRVAAAAGIELPDDPWEMNVRAVSTDGGEYSHAPSMLLDVQARRRTEIEFNTGAIVREAERLGVPAPLNTAIYRLERARESAW